ncbi:Clp protease N-terminal domain-containing protein [Nocardioides cynanchi]|uniref:Clp protease N-terminal domain-containing protein n=1 Tax=Nocardioides cynanchi TaxID=2558918 RepID=UPI001247BE5B|nr:Clp protease N-terminal domain-containing protein [Nocardioides cynanchi]
MYSRFDTEARIAVAQATDLARELGHSQVGPDHLLLGLLANMRGTAYAALTDHGLRLDAAHYLVVTQHAATTPTAATAADRPEGGSDETDRLAEDREALRAIGIDLDRVTEAVRANLGADLVEGWGSRSGRGRPERRGRGRRHHDHHDHHDHQGDQEGRERDQAEDLERERPRGRGRRGPRSRRDDGPRFSPALRDLLHDVRRAPAREAMTGRRLALALLDSEDAGVRGVLATATDLDGLRARLEAADVVAPTA